MTWRFVALLFAALAAAAQAAEALGFGLMACFLLSSYAGQALARPRSQGTGPN